MNVCLSCHRPGVRGAVMVAALALGVGFVLRASAATMVHEFYLPMPEDQIRSTFTALETGVGTSIDSVFSIVLTGAGTVLHYDQWEDGYEIDINSPTQATTQIWGDGNNANGKPPGYASDPLAFPAGTVLTLRNIVPYPRASTTNVLFDARDRMAGSKALVVSRTAWAPTPGTVLAGASEVTATIDYGTNYVCPVGVDVSASSMFEYVGLFVMAEQNGTLVTIDTDGAGANAPFTVPLNRGESHLVNGGIRKGARVVSTKPVQAHLVTGDIGARYETDWFTLYPVEQWDSSYVTPVGTSSNGNACYVFVYNPNTNAITVNYSTRTGSGSFSVATNGVYQYLMPQNSGALLAATNGARFFAISTVGASPTANNVYDWGFTLLPSSYMTTEAVVGWGPGSGDLSVNGSPVWVTPVAATRVYVDYNGDRQGALTDPAGNKYDVHYDLGALQSKTIYDPDKDQTAMRLYTLSGIALSTAWGEDPAVAAAGNPYLDVGTTVLPFPVPVLTKTSRLYTDNAPSGTSTNDILEYTISVDNKGLLPLGNTVVIDQLPSLIAYMTNTTTWNGTPIADNVGTNTPFPLDESGYTIPIILRGGTSRFVFRVRIVGSGAVVNSGFSGSLSVSNAVVVPPSSGAHSNLVEFVDAATNGALIYTAGDGIYVKLTDPGVNQSTTSVETVSVIVRDTTSGDLEVVVLRETGPNTGIFVSTNALPTSLTTGLGQQDGTLYVSAGDALSVSFTDPLFGDATADSATVIAATRTKYLYLTTDGGDGDFSGSLDRIDPVATGDSSTSRTRGLSGASMITQVGAPSASNSTQTATNHSFIYDSGTTGSNRMLMVGVSYRNRDSETVTSATYGGLALTQVGTAEMTSGNPDGRIYVFCLTNPPTGANSLQVDWSSALNQGAVVGAVTYAGVAQSTPSGFAWANGTSVAPAVTVTSATGRLVFGVVAGRTTSDYAVTGGGTSLWSLRPFSGQTSGAGQSRAGASPTVSLGWSGTADEWVAGGVSLDPADAAAGVAATFVQAPAMALNFGMPSGGGLAARAYVETTNGVLSANPNMVAVIFRGGTAVATLTNASATLMSGGPSAIVPVSTSSASNANATALTFSHDPGTGTNRLLLVAVAVGATTDTGNPPTVSGVTYGGTALTLAGSRISGAGGASDDAWSYIYRLINPGSGPSNVVVSLSGAGSVAAGATTFTGVHPTVPLGTVSSNSATSGNASVVVASGAGELVFDVVARDEGPTLAAAAGQTSLWSVVSLNAVLSGASSHRPGAAVVTNSYTSGDTSQDWSMLGVSIKPVVTTAVYRVDWSTTLPAATSIPAGDAISLVVSNGQPSVGFSVLYDSSNYPSRVSLPTTNVIEVASLAVYDAPYPDGTNLSGALNGDTLYIRATVTDPFGSYDISRLALSIDGAGTNADVSVTLSNAQVVASNSYSKTYEYTWSTVSVQGNYAIGVTAYEGTEGITASAAIPFSLTYLDLGTPSITEFTTGANGPHTLTYATNETVFVRVTDLDQNTNSAVVDTITVVITNTLSGDWERRTLAETGPNTGVFTGSVPASATGGAGGNSGTLNAPGGSPLVVMYTDPNDSSDQGSDTATIPLALPALTVRKMLVEPADGQAVVGDALRFQVEVINSGNTTLSTVAVTDDYPSVTFTYVSATPTPSTVSAGALVWTNVGPLRPGDSTVIDVYLTASASSALATNRAVGNAGGGVAATGTATVVVTRPGVTVSKSVLSPIPGPAVIGDNVQYRIVVSNSGDTALAVVPMQDLFSSIIYTYVSATIAPDVSGPGSLYWVDLTGAGTLAAGAAITNDITLRATGGGSPAPNAALIDSAVDMNGDYPPPASSVTGVTITAVTISGSAYDDRNTNGAYNAGIDLPLEGVTVRLYTDPNGDGDPADGSLIDLIATSVGGAFEFLNLGTGRYVVIETDLPGYVSSGDTAGANDNRIPVSAVIPSNYAGNIFLDYMPAPASYATIRGTVFNDLDADGLADDGGAVLGGVALDLIADVNSNGVADLGEPVYGSATTATNGTYVFTGIPAGAYVIRETDPAGFTSTADTGGANDNLIAVSVAAGATSSGHDFLDTWRRSNAAIGDRVWLDENADGSQDAGEAGIPNVTVRLYDTNGTLLATAVTDLDGRYRFPELDGGTYVVRVDTNSMPAGLAANPSFDPQGAVDGAASVTAAIDLPATWVDFGYTWAAPSGVTGNTGRGMIGDRVWADANGNGIQEPGEAGLSGVEVSLYTDPDTNGVYDTLAATALTDINGRFAFTNLAAAGYSIRVAATNFSSGGVLSGFTGTGDPDHFGTGGGVNDGQTTSPIVLSPGDVFVNADFGYQPPAGQSGSIGGIVWFDADASSNSAPDAGEYRVAGVSVNAIRDTNGNGVWDSGEPIVASVVTDTNGAYRFDGLPFTNYIVSVSDVAGVVSGLVPTFDADGLATPGASAVSLSAGSPTQLSQDFSYTDAAQSVGLGLIGDTVFLDANGDGVAQPGEGISGVVLVLRDASGTTLGQTITDGNGHYAFGGLFPGVYVVEVVTNGLLPGMTNSVDPDGGAASRAGVTIGGSEPLVTLGVDFGYRGAPGAGSIGGTVWSDRNASGLKDGAETNGYAGVTVYLYWDANSNGTVDPGEPALARALTDASGNYVFTNLPVDAGAGGASYIVDVSDVGGILFGAWHTLGSLGVDDNSQSDPYAVTLTPGAPSTRSADFGYYTQPGALGNLVWADVNDNGLQDAGEPGISNAYVTLMVAYPDGTTNAVVVRTDTNGYYAFTALLLDENFAGGAGTGQPVFVLSARVLVSGFVPTTVDAGGNAGIADYIDSDLHTGVTGLVIRGASVAAGTNPTNESASASFDFGFKAAPTLARIVSFGAFSRGGQVVVTWQTSEEIGTVGFYLERLAGGGYVAVSPDLIPSQLFAADGATYEQADPGAQPGGTYTYRLIELEMNGNLRYAGPYTVTVGGAGLTFDEWTRRSFTATELANPLVSGAGADPDGDGLSNEAEFRAGTSPTDAKSVLRIRAVETVGGAGVAIRWSSASNRFYAVERAGDPTAGFQPVQSGIAATPPENVHTDAAPGRVFYRIRVDQ